MKSFKITLQNTRFEWDEDFSEIKEEKKLPISEGIINIDDNKSAEIHAVVLPCFILYHLPCKVNRFRKKYC